MVRPFIHGTPFKATVSVNNIRFDPLGSSEGTEGSAYVAAGAITGGVTQQEPLITTCRGPTAQASRSLR